MFITMYYLRSAAPEGQMVFCEGFDELPVIIQLDQLHLTENFLEAIKTLNGLAGIYCIKNVLTGAIYIGSSIYLADQRSD